MDKVLQIISRKPPIFVLAALIYMLLVGFLKWQFHPSLSSIWFLVGGALGIYFLDAGEAFFNLNPSPFRSILFEGLFGVVSFFVVTSSGSMLASGLVLSLFLSILLWQIGEWKVKGNLTSWYIIIATNVSHTAQRWIFFFFAVIFLLQTYLFIQ